MALIGIVFFTIYFGVLAFILAFGIKCLYQADYYSVGFKTVMIILLVCTLLSTVVCGAIFIIMAL